VSLLLDIGYLFAAILATPWFVYRLLARGDAHDLASRFGFRLGPRLSGSIWLHGSSAGEIALLAPLVELIEQSDVGYPIVISAYSSTGLAAARRTFPDHTVIVFPFDVSFVVRRVFAYFQPRLVVIVESEFWPNFLRLAHRRHIPVVVVNGKISEQSRRRYARFPFLATHLRRLDLLGVQTAEHAERFRSLGVPADRLHTTGNMKYDSVVRPEDAGTARALRQRLGFADSDTVIIGGSLHEREDAALIEAFAGIRSAYSSARLILVPRYPADCDRAERLLYGAGFGFVRKSMLDGAPSRELQPDEVMIVDTVGDLRLLYGVANIALVGGSLFYRGGNKGGHNLMEPAVFGVPVLFGPYTASFAETARALSEEGGGFEIADQAALRQVLERLFEDAALRVRSGQRAREIIESRRGATRKNFELLLPLLDAGAPLRLRDLGRNSTMPPTLSDLDSPR
jgi:3-deoxy-D-manno-octulosonic-acid transferase